MKDKDKMIEKLYNEFLDKDLQIILEETIETQILIDNAKILMNNKRLIISDCNNEEIMICLNEMSNIEISKYFIKFKIVNQLVTIFC